MKYFIFHQYSEGRNLNETRTRRLDADGDLVFLVSNEQLKAPWFLRRRHHGKTNDFNKEYAIHSFDSEFLDREGVLSYFETFLKKTFNIKPFYEKVKEEHSVTVNKYTNEFKELLDEVNDFTTYTLTKKSEQKIIYLLMKDDIVVYVGQSNSTSRPFQHTDKKWDKVKYIMIPTKYDLNFVEKVFIDRYKPKYNKANPFKDSIASAVYSTYFKNKAKV